MTTHHGTLRLLGSLLLFSLLLSGCVTEGSAPPRSGERSATDLSREVMAETSGFGQGSDSRIQEIIDQFKRDLTRQRAAGARAAEVATLTQLSQMHLFLRQDLDQATTYGNRALEMIEEALASGPDKEPDTSFPSTALGVPERSRQIYGVNWVAQKKGAFYHHHLSWVLLLLDRIHVAREELGILVAIEEAVRSEEIRRKHQARLATIKKQGAQAPCVADNSCGSSMAANRHSTASDSTQNSASASTTKSTMIAQNGPSAAQKATPLPRTTPLRALSPTQESTLPPPSQPESPPSEDPLALSADETAITPENAVIVSEGPQESAPAATPLTVEPEADVRPRFESIKNIDERKRAFFRFMLPYIRTENKRVIRDREKIKALWHKDVQGIAIEPKDQAWLADISTRYAVARSGESNTFFTNLLMRVDVVPPSLALAQSASESGWGTSRFAIEGNNYFGKWCFEPGCGIVPNRRDPGLTHEVARYATIADSVSEYTLNLNTNMAYAPFRELRANQRANAEPLSGSTLSAGLMKYSANGKRYIRSLNLLISANRLERYD
ncbi:MAG: glucosaminidase domain-containing protein [Magnetococcales bacterium]|nr:glucosaminidase domain-containing protein [Magnetococcales bacterium]